MSEAIGDVLSTFYGILSGRPGAPRDWARMRSLFHAGARLFPNAVTRSPAGASGVDIDTYITTLERFLGQNEFHETGEVLRVDITGTIASVVSSYEARRTSSDPAPTRTGINLVHLLQVEGQWKVTSMIWQDTPSRS